MSKINQKTETLDETTTIVSYIESYPYNNNVAVVMYVTTDKTVTFRSHNFSQSEDAEIARDKIVTSIKEEREDHVSNTLCYD